MAVHGDCAATKTRPEGSKAEARGGRKEARPERQKAGREHGRSAGGPAWQAPRAHPRASLAPPGFLRATRAARRTGRGCLGRAGPLARPRAAAHARGLPPRRCLSPRLPPPCEAQAAGVLRRNGAPGRGGRSTPDSYVATGKRQSTSRRRGRATSARCCATAARTVPSCIRADSRRRRDRCSSSGLCTCACAEARGGAEWTGRAEGQGIGWCMVSHGAF